VENGVGEKEKKKETVDIIKKRKTQEKREGIH